ncbi:MAG: 4Fe-4S dicluster domain-containing protein [Chloroflexota bacterium]|nr:MAG: 4Fe-4S dicluster domain-containing protein [Chloroflexota bacterium]
MAKGMFVDTSVCIGCKACQVACKEWNELTGEPDDFKDVDGQLKAINFTGDSYDNTGRLTATNWRHVRFIENITPDRSTVAWYMMSDSCKHCIQAGCLEVCPTHALMRTDLGNVIVQQDVCNGCRACIAACPFGVISYNTSTGRVNKCTLCDDRIHIGLETACAKACPTDSIIFGEVTDLRQQASQRVDELKGLGFNKAQIYGDESILGGLNVFYLLLYYPHVYRQPVNPRLPQAKLIPESALSIGTAIALGVAAIIAFRERGSASNPPEKSLEP